jgi:transaldolase
MSSRSSFPVLQVLPGVAVLGCGGGDGQFLGNDLQNGDAGLRHALAALSSNGGASVPRPGLAGPEFVSCLASTSTKDPDLPDTYYLGRLAAPGTIDTVPEKTLLAFADHGSLDQRLEPNYAAAERTIAAIADAGIDADVLAERLQREGAGRFGADWAALLAAIREKAGTPQTKSGP